MAKYLKVEITDENLKVESEGLSIVERAGIISYLQMQMEADFVKIEIGNQKQIKE